MDKHQAYNFNLKMRLLEVLREMDKLVAGEPGRVQWIILIVGIAGDKEMKFEPVLREPKLSIKSQDVIVWGVVVVQGRNSFLKIILNL